MDVMLRIVEFAFPVCASFGVLFMTASPAERSWRRPAEVRWLGIAMVSVGLLGLWLTVNHQRAEIDLLNARVGGLERTGPK